MLEKDFIVLSLFDGISSGKVALDRAGIKVNKYYASEIDKYAIKVSENNYPDNIQLGDINNWQDWNLDKIDLLIGGSPCQGFSFAGKQLNFEDPRSKLFFKYVDILNYYKPKYFLLENVKMKKEYQDVISEYLGVQPIEINSRLLSAQDRKRLYWTNIPGIEQPKDKHIYLKDILEKNVNEKYYMNKAWIKWWEENKDYQLKKKYSAVNSEKAITMTTRQYSSWNGNFISEKSCAIGKLSEHQGDRIFDINGKGSSLSSQGGNNAGGSCNIIYDNDNNKLRKLTPIECERLQTVPDDYTNCVSDNQRYKMLGNGWTVDVISHILSHINLIK